MHATTVLLANTNRGGASSGTMQSAVRQIERAGDSRGYLEAASRRNGWRGHRPVSVLNAFRKLGPMNLMATEAWEEAEQIAQIVDGMLS